MTDQDTGRGVRVTPPGAVLDPMIALVTSVHASPGVYALLLGSGVSTAAGVPTGWDVVRSLVGRAAAAMFPDDPAAAEIAHVDPDAWWTAHGDGSPLGYSTLLAQLAPTAAARQALLAGYFEPTDADRGEGRKIPGRAHHAVAALVARGAVRVVVTTNFDRLIERALEDAGVPPQVIHRPEQAVAATPLAHARATVIKLHGDYADLDQLNTIDELSSYPEPTTALLRHVFNNYGLIVSGWSAEWDRALVGALEEVTPRRYPLFWSSYGQPREAAKRLIAQHGAVIIAGRAADEFFADIQARLESLDRLTDPPATRAMAVASLKRMLADPVRRVELFDLVDGETTRVVQHINDRTRHPLYGPRHDDYIAAYQADVDTLLHLLATGVFHDDGVHRELWTRTLHRLLGARTSFTGQFEEEVEKLRHLPALLALWTAGVACVLSGKEDLLAVLLAVTYRKPHSAAGPLPAVAELQPTRVLDKDLAKGLARWSGARLVYPQSRLLRAECRAPLASVEPADDAYLAACDRLEYLASLAAISASALYGRYPWHGEFAGELSYDSEGHMLSRQITAEIGDDWPFLAWPGFAGQVDLATATNARLSESLAKRAEQDW